MTGSDVFADGVLAGRVVLVTGGGTGLGRATAAELRRCGAEVVICGRRADVLAATAAELGAHHVAGDVRDADDAERIVRSALEGYTRALAREWAERGIAVVAIAAGHFDTASLRKYPEPVWRAAARTVPLGRLGSESEHAWLVALAASPLGRALSGSVITHDGARDNWFGPWPPPSLLDDSGTVPTEERRPRA